MKRVLLLVMVGVLTLIFISCTIEETTSLDNGHIKNIEKKYKDDNNIDYITDENADILFKELFGIRNLVMHKVYRDKKSMNIDIYFNENVERNEIDNIKKFIMKVFILKRTYKYTAFPYSNVFNRNIDWDRVIFKIFINETKIIEHKFNQISSGKLESNYYENTHIELPSRIVENSNMKTFSRKVRGKYWGIKDVVFEKLYKGNVLLIKLKGKKVYKDRDIQKIRELVEMHLATQLENEDEDTYGMNINYLGIIIQLYSDDEKYYEETYHNGQNKKYWFSEYWGNHRFFNFQ
ncbi:hypothetical protein [Anaeromicrobium sediminis]|uniref:Lipoprotein n=1 Tax=Anaeromicrobium sediminis TaxID=1478221 RepID=A0A267MNB6_9FIRM|nr:hypothetical protein [Anaeromicrobium sediminis]PAB60365.1 hypothetical protein CCE28_05570 [Anaeromicrobium sediminis]